MLTKIRVPIPQATSQPQGQRKRVASPASCRRRTRSHGWATLLFRSGHVDRGALQPAQAAKTEDTRGALRNKGLADSSSRAIHDQNRSRPNATNTRQRPSPSPPMPVLSTIPPRGSSSVFGLLPRPSLPTRGWRLSAKRSRSQAAARNLAARNIRAPNGSTLLRLHAHVKPNPLIYLMVNML